MHVTMTQSRGRRARHCTHCGQRLNRRVVIPDGLCNAAECQAERVRRSVQKTAERDWNNWQRETRAALSRVEPQVGAAVRQTGLGPEDANFLTVPLQPNEAVAQDPARVAALIHAIDKAIEQAFRDPAPDGLRETRRQIDAPHSKAADAACLTCRGHCCGEGGTQNAFMDAQVIQDFRAHHPELDRTSVRQAYVGRIPEKAVAGSCAFHGAGGCTLDRDQRSHICNIHFCDQLSESRRAGLMDGSGPYVVIAVVDGIAAIAICSDDDGYRSIDTIVDDTDDGGGIAHRITAGQPALPPESRSPAAMAAPRRCGYCGQASARQGQTCGARACDEDLRRDALGQP